jgi:hypothetical protein
VQLTECAAPIESLERFWVPCELDSGNKKALTRCGKGLFGGQIELTPQTDGEIRSVEFFECAFGVKASLLHDFEKKTIRFFPSPQIL